MKVVKEKITTDVELLMCEECGTKYRRLDSIYKDVLAEKGYPIVSIAGKCFICEKEGCDKCSGKFKLNGKDVIVHTKESCMDQFRELQNHKVR